MDWKKTFKPDRKKVAFAAVLFAVFGSLPEMMLLIADPVVMVFGLPLIFSTAGSHLMCVGCGAPQILYLNLVIDAVFWYLIACVLLAYLPKGRKR